MEKGQSKAYVKFLLTSSSSLIYLSVETHSSAQWQAPGGCDRESLQPIHGPLKGSGRTA